MTRSSRKENSLRNASQLMEAIKHSRAAIVVFSSHYAASTWCLDEMAAIADRHRESTQLVIPVFYDVDPSDV
ncbi:hypothetical protein Ahy_B08g093227 [Arachis hypogaea]|uniref:ADP-ribosyl cyclase/cyclic ADP-ribose hydrolase n=1 Tax=Arachis hypogaea TaxID=3818 RepID=A0A444Y5L8_ARAHY|nr:hypothetical protein Ahy_B08g093227 [Arachis hypogaea]